jgi:hypothetical protein
MARKSKLTNQQWQEVAQLRANGQTYKQISNQFGITRKAISDGLLKQDTPFEIVHQALEVMQDYDTTNATDYIDVTKIGLNNFLQKNTEMVNRIVDLQDNNISVCNKILQFIQKALSSDTISYKELAELTKLNDSTSRQIERLSRIYGMGTSQSQVNVQMNQNQNNFNSRGQRIYQDDEFTGDEDIEIIFCTSNEQAKILKSQECSGCSNLLDMK